MALPLQVRGGTVGPLKTATPAGTCSAPLLGMSHVDMRKKLHFPKAVTERSRLPLAARSSRSPREWMKLK